MKYIHHMKVLATYFPYHNETETTIAQLAEILNCSGRHVKTIMNYLDKEGFIDWKTARGRSKKPQLKLNYSLDAIRLKEAKEAIATENYREGFRHAEKLPAELQVAFQHWLQNHLGIVDSDEPLDILRYPFYETNLMMDPLHMISRHDAHMIQQIFDRLVEFDAATGKTFPKIAHHVESMDGVTWTFYLRKGVTFHHGKELTSEDVKKTFTRFPREDSLVKNIHSIECVSKYVVKFHLKQKDYLFPRYLTGTRASIVPADVIDKDMKEFGRSPVGSGPYQLTKHDAEIVRLDVFKNYYGLRPWLDRIEIIKAPSRFPLDPSHPLLLTAPDDLWKKVERMEEGADYIIFNCRKTGPVREKSFRKKLVQIIEPEKFCLPSEVVAHSFITERTKLLHPERGKPVEAKPAFDGELLIAAQQIREGVNHKRKADILKGQLEAAGIRAKVEIVPTSEWWNSETYEKYDLFVAGVGLAEDLFLSLLNLLQSKRMAIESCLPGEMREFLMEKLTLIREAQTDKERWRLYFEIEDRLKSEYAILFLSHRSHTVYEQKDSAYVNIKLDSYGRVDYRKVWKR